MKTKITLILFLFTFTSSSQGSTRVDFLGAQAMIQIFTQDSAGGTSPDADLLFQAMNVPTQGSALGQGKRIESSDQDLILICAQGPRGRQCTLFFKASSDVKMSPSEQKLEYHAQGEKAEALRQQFHLNVEGEFHLITSDAYCSLHITARDIRIVFDSQGL